MTFTRKSAYNRGITNKHQVFNKIAKTFANEGAQNLFAKKDANTAANEEERDAKLLRAVACPKTFCMKSLLGATKNTNLGKLRPNTNRSYPVSSNK